MVAHSSYSPGLLDAIKLPTAQLDLLGEVTHLDNAVTPLVHQMQEYQRADGSVEPRHCDAAAQTLIALRDELHRSALFPKRSREAFDLDLASWQAAGLDSPPQFDASRDAIEGPGDKELAIFAGPTTMPNSDTRSPLFQLVLIMRDEPDSLDVVRENYPHLESACQTTRVLTGSRQATKGQCVVLFPENIPAASKVSRAEFRLVLYEQAHPHLPVDADPDP